MNEYTFLVFTSVRSGSGVEPRRVKATYWASVIVDGLGNGCSSKDHAPHDGGDSVGTIFGAAGATPIQDSQETVAAATQVVQEIDRHRIKLILIRSAPRTIVSFTRTGDVHMAYDSSECRQYRYNLDRLNAEIADHRSVVFDRQHRRQDLMSDLSGLQVQLRSLIQASQAANGLPTSRGGTSAGGSVQLGTALAMARLEPRIADVERRIREADNELRETRRLLDQAETNRDIAQSEARSRGCLDRT